MFLQGKTTYHIAKILTEEHIPTPGGKEKWGKAVIESILTNEKYKGDALLQKVFTTDFLTKKKRKNDGQIVEQYDQTRAKLDKVNAELIEVLGRRSAVEQFLQELREKDSPVTEFSDELWLHTVQSVKVERDGSMLFAFKDGTEMRV